MIRISVPAAANRRRLLVDIAIAVAVTAVQLAVLHLSSSWHGQHGWSGVGTAPAARPGWPAYLLLGIGGLALVARRRFPTAVLAIAVVAAFAAGIRGVTGMIWIVPIAALFNAVWARKRGAAIASLAVGYLASFWPEWRIGQPGHASVVFAVGVAAWMLMLLAVAELIRVRGQRTAALALGRQEQARRQASEERLRMAREIHDVLAHNISVINVQANTALHLMDRQPERAREALTTIHEVSKHALAEMRSVLGMLRSEADGVPLTPSPGLAQVSGLVSAVGRAGLDVRLTVTGEQQRLPTEADLAAYRIIQEALTNTARHSASQTARVLVSYEQSGVLIQIDDDGPSWESKAAVAAGSRPGGSVAAASLAAGRTAGSALAESLTGGNGITGMTERAHALGGTLSAGPRADGGFHVVAWLPAREDTAPEPPEPPEPASATMPEADRSAQ
ncbi:MAG TPA: histidine kinase [Streptosporangiaceae bacterium]